MRRFDSDPRLHLIIKELHRECNTSVPKTLLFAAVFGLGFALGSLATCLTIQAVIFDQAAQFCVILLIAFLSGAACVWMGIHHGPRSFRAPKPLTPAEWAERNIDLARGEKVDFDPTSYPWIPRDGGHHIDCERMARVERDIRSGRVYFAKENLSTVDVQFSPHPIGPKPGQPGTGTQRGGIGR